MAKKATAPAARPSSPVALEAKSQAARKAWVTRRSAKYKANKTERASKAALIAWCKVHRWKVLFFEGDTGAARTGIVDAIIARISPGNADKLDIRFVQLKAGMGGLKAKEIARMKRAVDLASKGWLLAAHDGKSFHLMQESESR